VDDKKVKSPSYQLEIGQSVTLRKKELVENKLIKHTLEQNIKVPSFLNFDKQKVIINYLRRPTPEELERGIDTSLVVE
jgi:ribosomal protein S4